MGTNTIQDKISHTLFGKIHRFILHLHYSHDDECFFPILIKMN